MNGVMDMLEAKEAKDNNETVIVRHYPISPILSVSCVYQTKLKQFFLINWKQKQQLLNAYLLQEQLSQLSCCYYRVG